MENPSLLRAAPTPAALSASRHCGLYFSKWKGERIKMQVACKPPAVSRDSVDYPWHGPPSIALLDREKALKLGCMLESLSCCCRVLCLSFVFPVDLSIWLCLGCRCVIYSRIPRSKVHLCPSWIKSDSHFDWSSCCTLWAPWSGTTRCSQIVNVIDRHQLPY